MTSNFPASPLPPPVTAPLTTPALAASSPYPSPYLPAGTPPWPTTVLQRHPLPTAAPLTSTSGVGDKRGPRSPRRILAIVGTLLLVPILGVGLTYGWLYFNGQAQDAAQGASVAVVPPTAGTDSGATPTTTLPTSLPTPTSFSAMSNDHQKSLGVVVKYPSDWVEDPTTQKSTNGSDVARFHPQQRLGIIFFVGKFPGTTSGVTSTDALNKGLIGTIYGDGSTGNKNIQAVQPANPTPTIGGEKWDEQDATYSDTNGLLMHISSSAVKHGDAYYVFITLAPDLYYKDIVQKYIPPILDSFKFLS